MGKNSLSIFPGFSKVDEVKIVFKINFITNYKFMFSIIIPLYNKAAYIQKAIMSILSQTFREFEIIIVNDGSSDNSLEVVRNCPLSIVN